MKHFVQIYLAVQIMLFSTAIPALYADGICDDAISEGKQKYNAGDYQKAKELFEFAQSRCGRENKYSDIQYWIDKCNRSRRILYRIKNQDLITKDKWQTTTKFSLYATQESQYPIGEIDEETPFYIIDNEYVFYDMASAHITRVLRNDFIECGEPDFKPYDEVQLLIGYGECLWSVLYKGAEKYATFSLDISSMQITESLYAGCNKIIGNITKRTQDKCLYLKIKLLKTNQIGWIKIHTTDIADSEWNYVRCVYI